MNRKKQFGFTLIELMVTMAIIGIIAVIAVPTYLTGRQDYVLNRAINDYYGELRLMRGLAIKNRGNCSITFTNNSYTTTCTTSSYTSTIRLSDYDGVVVFEQEDGSIHYPLNPITCNSRGTCNQEYAYFTNTKRQAFYRVGPLISGVIKKDYLKAPPNDWESL